MRPVKGTRRPHQFVDDPDMRDPATGAQWCMCGLPFDNQIHQLPDRSAEQDHHRRRAGET